jgi:DNA-binding Lrp family transcriptional regulator
MLAHRLVDSGRTSADLAAVHAILRHAKAGTPSRAIAESVGISPSSVQRIVKAAREEASSGAA